MIELLLEAERALSVGRLDQAEGLYRQAIEHDPGNSIAIVGLARVALERGDDGAALALGRRALAIDPDNAAARRLVDRLAEVIEARGETVPADMPEPAPPEPAPPEPAPPEPAVPARPGLLRRLLRRG